MAKTTTNFQEQTRTIQKLTAYVLAALAIVTAYLMSSYAVTQTLSYMVRDEVRSQVENQTVFGLGVRNIMTVQIKWLLMGLLLAGAAVALLAATRWIKNFDKGIKDSAQPIRWLDYAISTVIAVEIVALLSGVTDVAVMKVMAALILVSAYLGLVAERQNKGAKKPVKHAFVLHLVTGLLPWVFIAYSAVATYVFGMVRAPWYVYALYVVLLGSFALTSRIQWMRFKGNTLWKNVAYIERTYASISLVTKLLFAAILIIGLQK